MRKLSYKKCLNWVWQACGGELTVQESWSSSWFWCPILWSCNFYPAKSSNLIKWTFISSLTWSLQSLARAVVICTSVLLDVPGQPPTSKLLPAMAIWWLAMATPCKVPIGTLEDCDGFFYTDRLVTEPMLTKAKKKTSLQKWNQETMQQLTCLHLSNKELNKVR